jgi:DNA-binding MurR/RpiR family transcriptional regulator
MYARPHALDHLCAGPRKEIPVLCANRWQEWGCDTSNKGAVKRVATPTADRQPVASSPIGGTSEHQSLSKYIRARFDECSRSQKDVAQYIVDHLDEAAFQTAEELARRANTSSSTVVRFSQALGFEGFPELQAAAREEYRRVHAKTGEAAAGAPSAPLFSLDQNEFETALTADHLNVEETARKVSRSSVESLIEAIVSAEKVLVAGTDQMAFFASYLRHLLMLLDLRVDVVASPSQEALSRLGRIDEGTLVIGLSAGRPHPLVVRAMKLARHRKAKTAAITDATLSEVAKLAQIKLYYSSNSPAYVRSHTALLSLIQALAYGVYAQDSAQYDDRIKAFRLK